MRYFFISTNNIRDVNSFIRCLDPRVKLVSSLVFVLFVVLTPPTQIRQFGAYLGIVISIIVLARLPLSFVLRRSLVILPFVLLVGAFIPFVKEGEVTGGYSLGALRLSVSPSGLLILENIAIKAWLSVLSMITLIATTRLPELLAGLERLRVPRLLILLLSFIFRYVPLLADQVGKLRRASEARSFGKKGLKRFNFTTPGNIIGTLFIRTYERGERVYAAMLARGFTGELRTIRRLRFTRWDGIFFTSFISLLILVKVIVR